MQKFDGELENGSRWWDVNGEVALWHSPKHGGWYLTVWVSVQQTHVHINLDDQVAQELLSHLGGTGNE